MNYRIKKGAWCENLAKQVFLNQGFIFIESNYTLFLEGKKYGELDLIFTKGKTLVVVEVKYRSSDKNGNAKEALGSIKLKRLLNLAELYQNKNYKFNDYELCICLYSKTKGSLGEVTQVC